MRYIVFWLTNKTVYSDKFRWCFPQYTLNPSPVLDPYWPACRAFVTIYILLCRVYCSLSYQCLKAKPEKKADHFRKKNTNIRRFGCFQMENCLSFLTHNRDTQKCKHDSSSLLSELSCGNFWSPRHNYDWLLPSAELSEQCWNITTRVHCDLNESGQWAKGSLKSTTSAILFPGHLSEEVFMI